MLTWAVVEVEDVVLLVEVVLDVDDVVEVVDVVDVVDVVEVVEVVEVVVLRVVLVMLVVAMIWGMGIATIGRVGVGILRVGSGWVMASVVLAPNVMLTCCWSFCTL